MPEPHPALLGRKKLIGLLAESVAGTFNANLTTPIAANCYDIKCEIVDVFKDGERMPQGNYLGQVESIGGKKQVKFNFSFDVAPGGPLIDLLPIAGYDQPDTNSAYTPVSSLASRSTFSGVVWEDGLQKRFQGAAANLTLEGEDGKKLSCKVEGQGYLMDVTDAAMPAQSPIHTAPYVVRGSANVSNVTLAAGQMPHISKFTVDLGAQIEDRESISTALPSMFLVTEILPKLTLDPEMRKVADFDTWNDYANGTTAAAAITCTSGNSTLTIAAPKVQRETVTSGVRGRRATDELAFICAVDEGDDALQISEATT